jgi:hypothetical protein
VTFHNPDENTFQNTPGVHALTKPVRSAPLRKRLTFDDQDTLTLIPDDTHERVLPPSLKGLIADYHNFVQSRPDAAETSMVSKSSLNFDLSPLLPPASPMDHSASASGTIDIDRALRANPGRMLDFSITEDVSIDFTNMSSEPGPADPPPPLKSRFALRQKPPAQPLRPHSPSDEETLVLPKRKPHPIDVNTDFIDAALAGHRQIDLRIDDDDSSLDPDFVDLLRRLPAVIVKKCGRRLSDECAKIPKLAKPLSPSAAFIREDAVLFILRSILTSLPIAESVFEELRAAEEAAQNCLGVDVPDVEEKIARLKKLDLPVDQQSADLYVSLRKLMPFAVSHLMTREKPRVSVVASLPSGKVRVDCADGTYLHNRIAIGQRWKRFREEFLGMMGKFNGVMFADGFLSFLVSCQRLNCRFAVVLKIPTSYPWCRVAVASVRIDFGAELGETLGRMREIARAVPLGAQWLTRFADEVLRHYS